MLLVLPRFYINTGSSLAVMILYRLYAISLHGTVVTTLRCTMRYYWFCRGSMLAVTILYRLYAINLLGTVVTALWCTLRYCCFCRSSINILAVLILYRQCTARIPDTALTTLWCTLEVLLVLPGFYQDTGSTDTSPPVHCQYNCRGSIKILAVLILYRQDTASITGTAVATFWCTLRNYCLCRDSTKVLAIHWQ